MIVRVCQLVSRFLYIFLSSEIIPYGLKYRHNERIFGDVTELCKYVRRITYHYVHYTRNGFLKVNDGDKDVDRQTKRERKQETSKKKKSLDNGQQSKSIRSNVTFDTDCRLSIPIASSKYVGLVRALYPRGTPLSPSPLPPCGYLY